MSHNKYTHLELQPAFQFLLISGSSIQKQFLVNRQQVLKPKLLPKVNASIHLTLQLGRVLYIFSNPIKKWYFCASEYYFHMKWKSNP